MASVNAGSISDHVRWQQPMHGEHLRRLRRLFPYDQHKSYRHRLDGKVFRTSPRHQEGRPAGIRWHNVPRVAISNLCPNTHVIQPLEVRTEHAVGKY